MRFRQIHLDFHTSEHIPGIGSAFEAKEFQDALQLGHVDSVTVFSKCHHGLSYHPSDVGVQHPELDYDLLQAQIDAAHAIDVKTPVYISAGIDEAMYWQHPEWARRLPDQRVPWVGTDENPGFHELCLNTGYLDYLAKQVEEVCARYAADGIFLDIVSPRPCWCTTCIQERSAEGDHRDPALIETQARRTYLRYTTRMRAAIDKHRPGLPVFHNGGHIHRGDRELAAQNTHLELESLPTGGWGYDHFPLSAGYARCLGQAFLGMTGKFHFSWGEFGGYKHPNALRYEAAAAIAQGARVSVGDQLHPDGRMETATYALIGAAYAEVEEKEAWVTGARSLAEVALLSHEACVETERGTAQWNRGNAADEGAARLLLEAHCWFDVIDAEVDFASYRLLVLPDGLRCTAGLAAKLQAFVDQGGRLLLCGCAGFAADEDRQLFAVGGTDAGPGSADPCYVQPRFAWSAWKAMATVVYGAARQIDRTDDDGTAVLADRFDSYFNRDGRKFCSHRHTPNRREPAGPAIVAGPAGSWIAFDICGIYHQHGMLAHRELFSHCLQRELDGLQCATDLPSTARLTLMRQDANERDILHLLSATPVRRGQGVEVIEDLLPLPATSVALRRAAPPSAVTLAPSDTALDFTYEHGRVRFTVPGFSCHQMVVLQD